MKAPTTAAIQTPPGRGGIAVIALAGPAAGEIIARAFHPRRTHARDAEGVLRLGHLVDGGQVIDEAIVTRRGQTVEINLHGGPAVARAALHLLDRLGAEVCPAPAAAVESFPTAHPHHDNPAVGRELLAALPHVRGPLALEALTRQWSAGLSELAGRTIRDGLAQGSVAALRAAAGRLAVMQRLLHPAEVVLAGPPNAGKSALANALLAREACLVHEQAGTTRDWVRETALLNGAAVWLTDTAGLWSPPAGGVEAEAVRRARDRIARADIVLLLGPGEPSEVPPWLARADPRGRRVLQVSSKQDVCPPFAGADAAVSALTGEGLDELKRAILVALGLADLDPTAPAAFTQRQAELLARAADALEAGRGNDARQALIALLRP